MKKKTTLPGYFIVVITLVTVLILHYSMSMLSTEQTAFDNIGGNNINSNIIQTSITKIAETNNDITFRFSWLTDNFLESGCNSQKKINLKFNVADFELEKDKITVNNVENQFNIKSDEIIFTGLRTYQNPCESNQIGINSKFIQMENQKTLCNLVIINNKPIISCEITTSLFVEKDGQIIPVNYYGNIDGYLDIKVLKTIEK